MLKTTSAATLASGVVSAFSRGSLGNAGGRCAFTIVCAKRVIHKSYPQKEVSYPQRASPTTAGYPQKQHLSTKGGEVIHNWAAVAVCFALQSAELSTKSKSKPLILWITFPQTRHERGKGWL